VAARGGGTGGTGATAAGDTAAGVAGICMDTGIGAGLAIDTGAGGGAAAVPGRGSPVLWLVPQYGQYSTLRGNARAQAPFTHR
jgi:hypothetical protein